MTTITIKEIKHTKQYINVYNYLESKYKKRFIYLLQKKLLSAQYLPYDGPIIEKVFMLINNNLIDSLNDIYILHTMIYRYQTKILTYNLYEFNLCLKLLYVVNKQIYIILNTVIFTQILDIKYLNDLYYLQLLDMLLNTIKHLYIYNKNYSFNFLYISIFIILKEFLMYNSYDFIRLYNILNPTSDSDIVMINFNTLIESIKNDKYLFNNINACYINKIKNIIPISEN